MLLLLLLYHYCQLVTAIVSCKTTYYIKSVGTSLQQHTHFGSMVQYVSENATGSTSFNGMSVTAKH